MHACRKQFYAEFFWYKATRYKVFELKNTCMEYLPITYPFQNEDIFISML